MAGIPRRAWLALAVYAALIATFATSLYDPFESGEDDSWVETVVLAGAHLAVGIAVARLWVLAVPVVAAVVGFFATGGEALSWIILVLELPVALGLTGLGWAAGHFLGRRAGPVGAAVFAVAALPTAAAAVETVDRSRAPHLPAAVQRQLPLDVALGNLCPGAETSRRLVRRLEASVDVMVRELHRNPDALVTYTYYWADADPERRDITMRELAEEQLSTLQGACRPDVRRRLKAAAGV